MGSHLPGLSSTEFAHRLHQSLAESAVDTPSGSPSGLASDLLSAEVLAALEAHYRQLLRWNPRLSLVGPGTADEIVERHYGESLAALPLLAPTDRTLLDLGTGGGFPGIPLAIARPDLSVVLAEARQRKWAFLETALRSVGAIRALSCRCLNARVGDPLPMGWPESLDVVTMRAVRCDPVLLQTIHRHSPSVRFLLWLAEIEPDLPRGWENGREIELYGARRIREVHPR